MDSSATFFPSRLQDPGRGHAFAYLGPMCSGKTNEMLNALRRYTFMRKQDVEVLLFKYSKDNREQSGTVKSRPGLERRPDAGVSTGEEIWSYVRERAFCSPEKTFVVGIDEAHFIKGLVTFVERALDHRESFPKTTIIVYMAALDSTFEKKLWPELIDVLPLVVYRKLTAVCGDCQQREALLTRRDVESKELELIGGEEAYTATCFSCHGHVQKKN